MSNTTTALAVIDPEKFGDMIKLPDILKQNQNLTLQAKTKTAEVLKTIPTDLTKASIQELDSADAALNEMQVKLRKGTEIENQKRKPFTGFLNDIISLFTAEENQLTILESNCKKLRTQIAAEKLSRQKNNDKKKDETINKKTEAIEIEAHLKQSVLKNYTVQIGMAIDKINEFFYSQELKNLAAFEFRLRDSKKTVDDKFFLDNIFKNGDFQLKYHTHDEYCSIYEAYYKNELSAIKQKWYLRIQQERERIIDMIPSRRRELEAIEADGTKKKEADERIQKEKEQRTKENTLSLTDSLISLNSTVEVEKMNTVFDTHASSEPAIEQAKGTSINKIYVPKSMGAYIALLQSWIKYDMPTTPFDELDKKLKFVMKGANARLNAGEIIEAKGLDITDDISVRSSK